VEGVYSVTVCGSEGDMAVGGRSIALKDPEVVGAFIRALKAETASSLVRVQDAEAQRGEGGLVEAAARLEVASPDGDVVYDDGADHRPFCTGILYDQNRSTTVLASMCSGR
jgi:hypothetical protein